jgi:hypothetical protein
VPYELYWEMGHRNAFTRRYERVEIWRPSLEANARSRHAIIARNIQRFTKDVGAAAGGHAAAQSRAGGGA